MMLTDKLSAFADYGAEWVMVVLLLLSVLSVTVMIERGLFFFKRRQALKALASIFSHYMDSRDVKALEAGFEGQKELEFRSMRRMLCVWKEKGLVPDGLFQGLGGEYSQVQEKYLVVLGTLGNTAPFIGLFGTVIGIVKAFKSLSMNMEGGAELVMGDISEALVATAVGLFVAIPAVIAFNFFQRKLEQNLSRFTSVAQATFAALPDRVPGKEN